MVKIQINNIQQKRLEYHNAMTQLVAFRVSVLMQSLSHLNGIAVNFGSGNFISFKTITKKIIAIVGDNNNIPNGQQGYTNFIANYNASANNLGSININGLLQLCQNLLANANLQLSELLICHANNLLILNDSLLNNCGINTISNINIIKLAFDYTNYNQIALPIREYFRTNAFVKICPYCNIELAYHQTNSGSEIVRSFELDHFYDKARYPLLSYSFFNLVPSDHTCNVINKGVTEFNDEYHLNPYSRGYIDRIKFRPIGLTTSYEVKTVEIEILDAPATNLYKKINGNNQINEENGTLGNLNVFKIRSKYMNEGHHLASRILSTLHKENRHFKHLNKYFKALKRFDRNDNYIKWYEKELNLSFKSIDFNNKPYSKFCRDIHDYYFNKNATRLNKYIAELIETY